MLYRDDIKRLAEEVGFDLCGVARCHRMDRYEEKLKDWLSRGYQSSLGYMERNSEKRCDPALLVPGAVTVIVCAVGYKNRFSEGYPADFNTKIASYACNTDYHVTIREMLFTLSARLRQLVPELAGRVFVDTAPIAEKHWAVEAGLGWIGRQSLLVTPRFGTFVLLGEVVVCHECDTYDTPYTGVGCGDCHRCMEHCPTGAIVAERTIDTARCISCHTIEREPQNDIDLHGWIFGCDACQNCCPYNRKAETHHNPHFDPIVNPYEFDARRWAEMSPEEFRLHFGTTPMTRSGLERIRANICPPPADKA